ncbi:hypothetical protein OHA79_22915 [Streptomyces sp. NBC_00841]|uniref:hypothetical protein n=1 Tax=unclassified Streptomyces TaxID=2593676 RepID=UPI002250B39E|nr:MULTISPECIES: hypothetical protein [unclassified Streptomyces]MCX4534186.1 hypothetical protein [Streptomyces sp. NBC_01669]WSA00451.1 hypothetical protein OHA79_22915 [Streptomyces sp. NBC_00841]
MTAAVRASELRRFLWRLRGRWRRAAGPGTEPEYLLSTFGMDSDAGTDVIYLTATTQVSESMTVTAEVVTPTEESPDAQCS